MYFSVTLEALNLAIKMIKLKFRFKSKAFVQKIQRGFTLIELVVVIVVLGILSAVAVPKYIDYKESAGVAAIKGVAAALSAAAESNYAAKLAGVPSAVAMATCEAMPPLLTGGSLPDGYKVVTQSGSTASTATTPVAATGSAGSSPGTITPATQGVCIVSNTGFTATATFPFTATPS